jgi:uncharacterized protein
MAEGETTLLELALSGRPLNGVPVVDFHVHLGTWGAMHLPVCDEMLIGQMDRVGIRIICVNGILYPDVRQANDRVAEFVRRHPDRAVGFASLNPFQTDVEDELKRCLFEHGFRGIKVHEIVATARGETPAVSPRAIGGKWERVWQLAGEHRVPVLYHGVVTADDVRRFPETIFVAAHGLCGTAKFALAERPNFYVDTAYSQNTPRECAEAIRLLGRDRIVWGSDAPLDDFAQRLGIILDADLSDDDRKQILGGNALRLLGGKFTGNR